MHPARDRSMGTSREVSLELEKKLIMKSLVDPLVDPVDGRSQHILPRAHARGA